MKKIIYCVLVVIMMLVLCGFGNRSIGGNYTFTHIHISDTVEGYCAEVKKWYNSKIGIEALTEEFGSLFCSEGTYFLFEDGDVCPFCQE